MGLSGNALDAIQKPFKQVAGIMGSGSALWMVLNTGNRQCLMRDPFHRPVVQVLMRHDDFFVRHRFQVKSVVVVLTGDLNLARGDILHRVIAAMVTKF